MPSLKSIRQGVTTQLGVGFVSIYDSLGELPITNVTQGDAAYVKNVNNYYISDGVGWRNTTLANKDPYWEIEPSDSDKTIVDSATPLIIIAKANDSDNPNLVNQSVGTDSAQYMVDVTNDSSVFTFTPKTKLQIAEAVAAGNLTDSNGDFVYTFKWSDGINFVNKDVTIIYNTSSGGGGAISWGGDRGLIAGGQLNGPPYYQNGIDYLDISTTGDAQDFGDLLSNLDYSSGLSDGSRGVWGGGSVQDTTRTNTMQYVATSTLGNTIDFGDLQNNRAFMASASDGTKGYFMGGSRDASGSYAAQNSIEYITIQTTGNATDGANLSVVRTTVYAWNDATRSLVMGGQDGISTQYNSVDYFTMANLSTNAVDFGDLSGVRYHGGSGGDATYALYFGGYDGNGTVYQNIDRFTIQTIGNASDFGDMTANTVNAAGASNGTYTIMAGGGVVAKTSIDYVTVATPSNATDFGDLTKTTQFAAGLSGSPS